MVAPVNIAPTISLAPTIDLHNEYNFSENADTCGCCGFFKSTPLQPEAVPRNEELYVNHNGELEKFKRKGQTFESRLRANAHLAELIKAKFQDDPYCNNDAFLLLKNRLSHDFEKGEITAEKLALIIEQIYELKKEISESIDLDSQR